MKCFNEVIPARGLKINKKNPRRITNEDFEALVRSIRENPKFLYQNRIIVDENRVVLSGNQRLKACRQIGIKEIPCRVVEGLTELQKKQETIASNGHFGEWDTAVLILFNDSQYLDKIMTEIQGDEINFDEKEFLKGLDIVGNKVSSELRKNVIVEASEYHKELINKKLKELRQQDKELSGYMAQSLTEISSEL